MSNYTRQYTVISPNDSEPIEITVEHVDDCFGHHIYGCKIDEDNALFRTLEDLFKHYGYTEQAQVKDEPRENDCPFPECCPDEPQPIIAHMKEWHEDNDGLYGSKHAYWQAFWFQLRKKLDELRQECRHCTDVNPNLVVCDYCIEHLFDKIPIENKEDAELEHHIKSCGDISGHLEAALRILAEKLTNK